ncbi:MAG: HIT family protein [Planctomycetota bacterium]
MSSIFTRIIAGEIPCHRVWEDADHLAFLDIRPVRPGHVLVIPKREVSYLFDLEPAAQSALWESVRLVEAKLRAATGCARVVVSVVGWEVPHVHVHLVPTDDIGDFPFPGPCGLSPDELPEIAARIAAAQP